MHLITSVVLVDTLNEFVINNKKPLLGICVGLQMFADIGYEETETKGSWLDIWQSIKNR